MPSTAIREKIISELNLLPAYRLKAAYALIHKLRIDAKTGDRSAQKRPLSDFAGILSDWGDEEFDDFLITVSEARQNMFAGRPSLEADAS